MTILRFISGTVILTALACGGGGGGGTSAPTLPPPPPAPNIVTIDVLDNSFDPKQVQVQPGTTVRWVLQGNAPNHTTTEMATTWDSGFTLVNPGDFFEHTFTEADDNQTFEYSCVTHKDCCEMQGSIQVGQNAPPPTPGY